MNLEKEASLREVLKSLLQSTKDLKNLPKDIKFQKKENQWAGLKGLKAFKEYDWIAKNTVKGLVIPAAVGVGSYGGYKYIKNKQEKTAGLKDYWNATKDLAANMKEYKNLKKDTSFINRLPFLKNNFERRKAETLSKIKKGLIIPGVGIGATGVGYKALSGREKKAGIEESVTPTFQSVKNIVDSTTGGSIYGYKRSRNKEKTLVESIRDIINRATAGSIYGYGTHKR